MADTRMDFGYPEDYTGVAELEEKRVYDAVNALRGLLRQGRPEKAGQVAARYSGDGCYFLAVALSRNAGLSDPAYFYTS